MNNRNTTRRNYTRNERRRKALHKLYQKLGGLFLIAASIFGAYITTDATATLILVPFGLWLIFSKEQIVEF